MKIYVYTFCYNEMKIIPMVIDYWKLYADKVIVYDNNSTDGSKEYLEQYDWIEIRNNPLNEINDIKLTEFKNTIWKEAKEKNIDIVHVADIDEVLYCKNGIKNELERYKDFSVFKTTWYELITEKYIPYENNGLLYHQYNNMLVNLNTSGKPGLFSPLYIQESNFGLGTHSANYIGTVKETNTNIVTFHLNQIGLDYLLDKMHSRKARLSDENKRHGYGIHYLFSDEKWTTNFNNALKNSHRFEEKRADSQIFMLVAEPKGKEDPDLINNELYTPIQCGAESSKYDICSLKDNGKEPNMSKWNWLFFENTGSAYIANHLAQNYIYVGQCSYRRRLIFDENYDFSNIFKNYDIILPYPYKWGNDIYNMYKGLNNEDDFRSCLSIIDELYPEYKVETDLARNNNLMLYYSSGFIMKSNDYKKYFNWLFKVLFKFINDNHLSTEDAVIRHLCQNQDLKKIKYNISICAFLQERLFSIYIEHNYSMQKRYHVEYDKVNCKADEKYKY